MGEWRFDIYSALIGALLAWLIAWFLYSRREQLKALKQKLWSPVEALRRRMRTSEEAKYLQTLQNHLKTRLLFAPDDPTLIFQPPTFAAPPPLPANIAEAAQTPATISVPYEALLEGHTRLIIAGPQAAGRTTALVMAVWQTAAQASEKRPYSRFPVWLDLVQLKTLAEDRKEVAPIDRLAELATRSMPELLPKWLLQHLRREPSLLLVDNWELLPPGERGLVATWIAEVAKELPESMWIIASGETGYGPLVEAGFVCATLRPNADPVTVTNLYEGWAQLGEYSAEDVQQEALEALYTIAAGGASLLELTLRIQVYLQTGQIPQRPVDAIDLFLDQRLPPLDLGEGQEEVADHARLVALQALASLAKKQRLEGGRFERQQMLEAVESHLPPAEERHPKLEGAARKLLSDSGLLERGADKDWGLAHYLWLDFFTAWDLAQDGELGADMAKAHLYDPTWQLLLEFYAGLIDPAPMVQSLLGEVRMSGEASHLLRLARWATVSDEDVAWRKTLVQTLAKVFMSRGQEEEMRLRLGQALAQVAGPGARAFFIKMLRHPSQPVREAALRGLGRAGSTQDMAVLAAAMKDESFEIRRAAALALQDLGTPGATALLSQTLPTVDEELMLLMAEILATMPGGSEVLKSLVNDPDLMVRRAAARGLGRIPEEWARELLEEMYREDAQWVVRSAAELELNAQQERAKHGVKILPQPQVDEIEWLINWTARQGRGLGVGEAAREALVEAIAEGTADVKIMGALTLAQVGERAHLDVLRPLLTHDDPRVRDVASITIRQLEQRYHVYQGV